jgi:hypothetical protein
MLFKCLLAIIASLSVGLGIVNMFQSIHVSTHSIAGFRLFERYSIKGHSLLGGQKITSMLDYGNTLAASFNLFPA